GRVKFDLHHVSGIYSYVFLLVVVVTGVMMAFPEQLYPLMEKFTGSTAREQPEERPLSSPQQGPGLNLDQALAQARTFFPGAQPTFMSIPAGPRSVYDISFKYPEDQTPGGRSHIVLDRYSGIVLWREDSRQAPRGVKAANVIRPLHTGDIFG